MGYTNETTHYGIPLPLGTDKTTPMDYNASMQEVDTVLFGAKSDSDSALRKAQQVEEGLSQTDDNVTAVAGRVTTLEGTSTTQGNAIQQNAQDIADVRADALDMIEAKDEGTAQVATVAVTEGEYFRYNDVLYIATQNIAVGATIVPNTNCRATNVGTELNKLNSDVNDITDVVLSSGYTITDRQTRVKNGVAYMTFTVQKTINSSTPTGSTALINSGTPKPILDGNSTNLQVPCIVYTTGNRELASSLTIGTAGAINFIVTREMVDLATELGTSITLEVVCSFTYLVDES